MFRILKALTIAGLVVAPSAAAQHPRYDTYNGFEVDTTPTLPAAEVHPSLYFEDGDIAALQARKGDVNSRYFALWLQIRGDALRFRDDDMATLDENDRPRAAKTLAFWSILEDDTVAADKAIEALLLAYDGVPQTGQKPYDEIYRATWLQNYAAAYDWVHVRLTTAQDSTIRQRIADETQYLRDNLMSGDRLAPRPHNHRSKPAWAVGTAALALSDHPEARDWLSFALDAANTVTRYQFSADGIYREGGHYWMYNAVNLIPFLWHYLNVSEVDLFAAYQPAFEWPIRIRTGRGQIPNLEDGYLKPAPTHMVAAAYTGIPTDLNPTADFAAICQWNYEHTRVIDPNYTGATADVTWEIDEYILYDTTIVAAAPTASPTQFLEGGQIVFRSHWAADASDRYLLFHGVAEADNHNHPDQLSFFLGGYDAILAPDAGYGPDGFSDDRRSSWYTTGKAHNIVTADGYPPVTDQLWSSPIEYNVTPPSRYHVNASFFAFAEKESGYLRPNDVSLKRAIGMLSQDYFVVADVIVGSSSHVYRSYLHGRGSFQRQGNYASWAPWANRYGEAARLDAYLFPASADIVDATGYVSLFKDERWERYVEVSQTAETATFLQLLVPAPTGGVAPAATDLSTEDFTAARLVVADTVDHFMVQPSATWRQLDSMATDATLLWERRVADALTMVAVREARELESGAVTLTASVPATLALDVRDANALHIAAPMAHPAIDLEIAYPGADGVQEVQVNGQSVAFSYQDGHLKVGLIATGSEESASLPRPSPVGNALSVYPNPFSSEVTVVAPGQEDGPFVVAIYNVLGQEVRKMRLDRFHRQLTWDGTSDSGAPVPPGHYLVWWTGSDGAVFSGTVVRALR